MRRGGRQDEPEAFGAKCQPRSEFSNTNDREWLLSVVVWDGGLPLFVAASFWLLPELTATILIPIGAALLRAGRAGRQFETRGINSTLCRQFLLGSAICMLLLFEGLMAALHFAKGAPTAAWLIAVFLYFGYVFIAAAALRPPRVAGIEER